LRTTGLRADERRRLILFVSLLALPFAIGYFAAQITGRPSRLVSSPIFWSEAVIYLVYALVVDLRSGRVTAERFGVRKTYTRKQTPVDYWFVIALQFAALGLFGWLDWGRSRKAIRLNRSGTRSATASASGGALLP
jgi:hypothetical protein